jgi:Zn-dependent protease
MQPTSNDISFNLFGFPTVIQPFFWLIAVIIAALFLGPIDNMPIWIVKLILGMLGVLIAVLVHELGHAFAFRHLFHTPCTIVLHGFGGMAIPHHPHRRAHGLVGTISECFLAFAGPMAGFMLAFVAIILIRAIPPDGANLFLFFLYWIAGISIIWGILNLLPIYPMDGGQIAREIFIFLSPRRGIEFSLLFSMFFAALCTILALRFGQIFITFLFACFAYQNYLEFSARSFRR